MNFARVALRLTCFSLGFLLIALAGCRHGGGTQNAAATVRLIDAAPDAQNLSVAVDGQRAWKHTTFRSNTGFQGVGEGTYKIDIDADTAGGRVSAHNYLQCRKGQAYTVVAFGQKNAPNEPPRLRIFSEEKSDPLPSNKVRLRFINAGTDLGPVDVLFNNIVGFGDIPVGARSAPILLDSGAYEVKVNQADALQGFTGPVSFHFLPGHAYTLVVMGRRDAGSGAGGLSLESFPDDQ